MRLGLIVGGGPARGGDWRDDLEKVRIAEELGYARISTGEAWNPSAIPWLTLLAEHTERVEIASSILNSWSRTPSALAQEFAALEAISGGRMVLGLGSSGHLVIEGFHGVPFDRPLRRLREYVEVFNLLIAGQPLQYEGEIFRMERGFQLEYERPRDHVPVEIAAITPRSIRQTGEIADGIIPIHWPRRLFGQLQEDLRAAASAAGRGAIDFTIAAQTYVYLTDGTNDEAQWRAAREPLRHYINRMGDFYWQMLTRNGFEAEVAASRAAWAERDAEGALAAISEEMVREIQVIGPIESVREQLHARAEAGANLQMLHMPAGDSQTVGRTLEAFLR